MKNLFNLKNLKKIIILSILLFIYITLCAFSYARNISNDISDSVFRLHVIANSNSTEDQNLKYKVRDNLINYMNRICKNCSSKDEAMQIAKDHSSEFKNIALNTIHENGFTYDVNIEIGNFEFPTKNYGDISLPAGYYDALKVEIGEAKGKNWWCVMFPPLCFVDISSGIVPEDSKNELKKALSDEEYAIISDNSCSDIKLKFKILELLNNKNISTAKK